MFTPNGFVLKQACFHVVNMFVPESSILNEWDIFKASQLTCSLPHKTLF